MAKDIVLNGQTYRGVKYITLKDEGGNDVQFIDVDEQGYGIKTYTLPTERIACAKTTIATSVENLGVVAE